MAFEIVCEIEPPTRPDLKHVRHQIGVLGKVASAFLIPDNHIGRATVSSVAVAHEVEQMGGRSIACLNARDRNLLGFRRDLLTAAAYGVDQFLFVYGDRPTSGARTGQLTVRSMIEELRGVPDRTPARHRSGSAWPPAAARCRRGSATPTSCSRRCASRSTSCSTGGRGIDFDGPVYAGVMVVPSAAMARKIGADIAAARRPRRVARRDRARPECRRRRSRATSSTAIRESGAFDGVHLIPVSRYREVAARLEARASRASAR